MKEPTTIKYAIGLKFGRLTIISAPRRKPFASGYGRVLTCRCDCGKVVERHITGLSPGSSCGCGRKARKPIHGHTKKNGKASRTYTCWQNMKDRCLNPNNRNYHNYGGRGISICGSWLDSFQSFLADMGEAPPGMTIERRNVDGNYEPSNCCWASKVEQTRNQKRNVYVVIGGRVMTLMECAQEHAVSYRRLHGFHRTFGLPIEEAIERAKRAEAMSVEERHRDRSMRAAITRKARAR